MTPLNKILVFSSLLLISAVCGSSEAISQYHSGGKTYSIAEQDALEEIRERSEKADVKEYVNKTPRSDWSVWGGHPLPVASENRVRGYVPWFTLDFDIKGAKGEVIYPKGFTFNPLEYVTYNQRIVVFKLDQIERLKPYLKPGDMLIADSGDVVEAGRILGKHIYILDEKLANRLGVKFAPSFVEQKNTKFQINEVNLDND